MILKKSEIKFGLVFSKLDEAKLKRQEEKIQQLVERQQVLSTKTARKSEKVEELDKEERLSFVENSNQPINYGINFSIQREETMMFADCLSDNDDEDETG